MGGPNVIFMVASCGLCRSESLPDHGHCLSAVMGCFPAPEMVTAPGPAQGSGLEGGYSVTHSLNSTHGCHQESSNKPQWISPSRKRKVCSVLKDL